MDDLTKENEIYILKTVTEALKLASEKDDVTENLIGMYWSKNLVSRMAEAACSVLFAHYESQKELEDNEG